jgi:hypothetical protein
LDYLESTLKELEHNHISFESRRTYERRLTTLRRWFVAYQQQHRPQQLAFSSTSSSSSTTTAAAVATLSSTSLAELKSTELADLASKEEARLEQAQPVRNKLFDNLMTQVNDSNVSPSEIEDSLFEEKLRSNRQEQENISEDMVQYAKQLKENSLNIFNQLQKENKVSQ